jgi:hypothetical protein
MSRPYRASNKRIVHRGGGGKFRRSTLGDIGFGECDKCGAIFVPDFSGLDGPFIDPRDFNQRRRTCGPCLGLPKAAVADAKPPASAPETLDEACDRWFGEDAR